MAHLFTSPVVTVVYPLFLRCLTVVTVVPVPFLQRLLKQREMQMYDLRDPSYVPPHLRAPAQDAPPERDNVVPLVQPEKQPSAVLQARDSGVRYTQECVLVALDLMYAAGVVADEADGSYSLLPELRGLSADQLRTVLLSAVAKLHGGGEAPRLGRPPKYPFATMEVGDVFVVHKGPEQPKESSFRVYCINTGNKLGRKFRMNLQPDGSYAVTREA